MKPKSVLRIAIIFMAALVSVFFLESVRKSNKVCNKPVKELSAKAGNFRAGNNYFIFFESVSKYPWVSF